MEHLFYGFPKFQLPKNGNVFLSSLCTLYIYYSLKCPLIGRFILFIIFGGTCRL